MAELDSALFLEFIMSNGFNPNNYEYILELIQSAPLSISQYLNNYKQYLLSRKVNYDELDLLGIDGAYGYYDWYGVVVPKTIRNDVRFLYNNPVKKLTRRHSYNCPTTDDFDVMIANGASSNILNTISFTRDKFLGFCISSDDPNFLKTLSYYAALYNRLSKHSSMEYEMVHDKDIAKNKEFYLIKRKK